MLLLQSALEPFGVRLSCTGVVSSYHRHGKGRLAPLSLHLFPSRYVNDTTTMRGQSIPIHIFAIFPIQFAALTNAALQITPYYRLSRSRDEYSKWEP